MEYLILGIILYFVTLIVLYFVSFYELFSLSKQRILVVLENEYELRGGGWFMTHTIEITMVFGIPVRIENIQFERINDYCEPSFEPFWSLLTEDLFFRDVNYSMSMSENLMRMKKFYENSLHCEFPKKIVFVNVKFFEAIFAFLPWIRIGNILLTSESLFRWLTHLTGDSEGWLHGRKFILVSVMKQMIFKLLCIPILPHIFSIVTLIQRSRKNLLIISGEQKSTQNVQPFLAVVENNLKGRKSNRFLITNTVYHFFVQEIVGTDIKGICTISVSKAFPMDYCYPITGPYQATLHVESSCHFGFESSMKTLYMKSWETETVRFSANFEMPKSGVLTVLKQRGLRNAQVSIAFSTESFVLIPVTSLPEKLDNLHLLQGAFEHDEFFRYSLKYDDAPLRMTHRVIYEDGAIQVSFQKKLGTLNIWNFELEYDGKKIPIEGIEYIDVNRGFFLNFEKGIVPYYPKSERKRVLRLIMKNIFDFGNIPHYPQGRNIWFPWSIMVDQDTLKRFE